MAFEENFKPLTTAAGAPVTDDQNSMSAVPRGRGSTNVHPQGIIKVLVGAAVALGFCVGGAAPVSADPNPIGSALNSFSSLRCSCRETAPPGSPALREEIEQGIREGRSAWLPGLAPSTQPRQSP